jgi:glutathione S-transferase
MSHRYTLHGNQGSGPTYKVALMLALAGEGFAYRHIDLRAGEQKAPGYLALNRFGQVPCLVDNSNGRCLAQSAAILEYLADKIGRFGGATLDERFSAREWMFWDFDRFAPGVFRPRVARLGIRQLAPEVVAYFEADGRAGLALLDETLAHRDWLVGEGPSIADIDIYGVISQAPEAGYDLATYPHLTRWTERFEALPGFRRRQDLLPAEDRE